MSIQATVSKNWGAVVGDDGVQSTASVASSYDKTKQSQSSSVSISDVTAERYTSEFEVLATEVVNTANGVQANATKLQLAGLTSSVAEGAISMSHLVSDVTDALDRNPNESTKKIAADARKQQQEGTVIQSNDRKQYQNSPQTPFKRPEVEFNDAPAPVAPTFGS
jgi:hypothetical protein